MTMLFFLLALAVFLVFVLEMAHSLRRSSVCNRLIQTYDGEVSEEKTIEAIYRYAMGDFKLRRILRKYGASKKDLQELHRKLLLWGDFKKGRRYVPISSFFYVYTLNYLLLHKDEDAKQLTMKCMNFFHI